MDASSHTYNAVCTRQPASQRRIIHIYHIATRKCARIQADTHTHTDKVMNRRTVTNVYGQN